MWFPPFLLQPRPPHLPWHEEEDQVRAVRVPQARVDECVLRRQGPDQGLPQDQP